MSRAPIIMGPANAFAAPCGHASFLTSKPRGEWESFKCNACGRKVTVRTLTDHQAASLGRTR